MKRQTLNMIKKLIVLTFVTTLMSGCKVNGVFFQEPENPPAHITAEHEVVIRNASDGEVVRHYLFKTTQVPKATVFALQEYGETVANSYQRFQPLVKEGYQVFMMEYRPIGQTEFEIPHVKIVSDTVNAIDLLRSLQSGEQSAILLMGQGYGAQPAIYAAHIKHGAVDALVIEGAFSSFSDQAKYAADNFVQELISKVIPNVYSGIDIIEHVKLPTLVIHSVDDTKVPFAMGKRLSKASGYSNVELWQISGAHLAGLKQQPEDYVGKVNQLLEDK